MTRNRLSRSRRNKRYDKLYFKLPEPCYGWTGALTKSSVT